MNATLATVWLLFSQSPGDHGVTNYMIFATQAACEAQAGEWNRRPVNDERYVCREMSVRK
jgi:hypothetical protein